MPRLDTMNSSSRTSEHTSVIWILIPGKRYYCRMTLGEKRLQIGPKLIGNIQYFGSRLWKSLNQAKCDYPVATDNSPIAVDFILAAVLTVSPNTQNLGSLTPIIPAAQGPVAMPWMSRKHTKSPWTPSCRPRHMTLRSPRAVRAICRGNVRTVAEWAEI